MGRLSDLPQEIIDVIAGHLLFASSVHIDTPWGWRGATIWNKRLINKRFNAALRTLLFQRADCMIVRRCRKLQASEKDDRLALSKFRTYRDALSRVLDSDPTILGGTSVWTFIDHANTEAIISECATWLEERAYGIQSIRRLNIGFASSKAVGPLSVPLKQMLRSHTVRDLHVFTPGFYDNSRALTGSDLSSSWLDYDPSLSRFSTGHGSRYFGPASSLPSALRSVDLRNLGSSLAAGDLEACLLSSPNMRELLFGEIHAKPELVSKLLDRHPALQSLGIEFGQLFGGLGGRGSKDGSLWQHSLSELLGDNLYKSLYLGTTRPFLPTLESFSKLPAANRVEELYWDHDGYDIREQRARHTFQQLLTSRTLFTELKKLTAPQLIPDDAHLSEPELEMLETFSNAGISIGSANPKYRPAMPL